jgi:hypothetical protein
LNNANEVSEGEIQMEREQRERYTELYSCSVKELQDKVKVLGVKGRHKMNKEELIGAIIAAEAFYEASAKVEENRVELIEISKDEAEVIGCAPGQVEVEFVEVIPESKVHFIENASAGTIVAFRVQMDSGLEMFSGKITKIGKTIFEVETKNGKRFVINKCSVAWVKTGPRWPKGIYEALRGETQHEYKAINPRN